MLHAAIILPRAMCARPFCVGIRRPLVIKASTFSEENLQIHQANALRRMPCTIHKLWRSLKLHCKWIVKSTDFQSAHYDHPTTVDYSVPTTAHKQILKLFIPGPDVWLWTLFTEHAGIVCTNCTHLLCLLLQPQTFESNALLQRLPTSFFRAASPLDECLKTKEALLAKVSSYAFSSAYRLLTIRWWGWMLFTWMVFTEMVSNEQYSSEEYSSEYSLNTLYLET